MAYVATSVCGGGGEGGAGCMWMHFVVLSGQFFSCLVYRLLVKKNKLPHLSNFLGGK